MQRVFRVVETSELRPAGVKATSAFVRSVRKHGIITPLLLAEVPDDDGVIELKIVDGNRRVRAAKAARIYKVPAVVLLEATEEERARLTLLTNNMRSRNFLAEYHAAMAISPNMEQLSREVKEMGLGVASVVGTVDKVNRMPDPVREAMNTGRMAVSVAKSVATLPECLKDEVVRKLQSGVRVDSGTIADLRRDWRARHDVASSPAPPIGNESWDSRVNESTQEGQHHAGAVAASSSGIAQNGNDTASPGLSPEHREPAQILREIDAALSALAADAHRSGWSRAVWMDRVIRAWESTAS